MSSPLHIHEKQKFWLAPSEYPVFLRKNRGFTYAFFGLTAISGLCSLYGITEMARGVNKRNLA